MIIKKKSSIYMWRKNRGWTGNSQKEKQDSAMANNPNGYKKADVLTEIVMVPRKPSTWTQK